MALLFLLPLHLSLLLSIALSADFVDDAPIERISFASCSHQDKEQPLWSEIARWDPDYFIWLGDAVYADVRVRLFSWVCQCGFSRGISRINLKIHLLVCLKWNFIE